MHSKPMVPVFAGPNGSGKSTITKAYSDVFDLPGEYINADVIKEEQHCSDLDAAKQATMQRKKCLEALKDFTFETVLSTKRNLNLLIKAKQQGYFIKGFFVLTDNPLINILRVQSRVIDGGHSVPKEKIQNRYHKSLVLLPDFIDVCDVVHIYDNTSTPERIFKKCKNGRQFIMSNDNWSSKDILNLIDNGKINAKEKK